MNSLLVSQLFPTKTSLDLQCWRQPSGICKILHNQCQSRSTIRSGRMNTSSSARGINKISSSVLSQVEALRNYDDDLQQLIHPELIPKHVAFIMDGFRRWAKAKGLPVHEGHTLILPKLKEICNIASKLGIQVVTAFAFSTENWNRSKVEVDFLMQQFEELFDEFMRFGVRVSVIGDRSDLPKTLQNCIALTEETTKDKEGLHLVIALNYGGHYDILQATKGIASKVKDGLLQLESIDKNLFEHELESKCAKFPNPDLLIRTGGEQRVSNFLLWQLAYSEFYFTKTLFPNFGEKDLTEALSTFQRRHRRFGGHTY